MTFAFKKQHKLLKTDEFSSVFDFRKAITGKYITISFKPNTKNHARIGIVVAKKLFPTAVERNLIKRQLREIFRINCNQLQHSDLVVRPRQQIRGVGYNALCDDFLKQVAKIR